MNSDVPPHRVRPALALALEPFAACIIFVGLWRKPYSYYVLERWIVSPVLAYLAAHCWWPARHFGLTWIFAVMAAFFNPIFPVGMDLWGWELAHMLARVILLLTMVWELNHLANDPEILSNASNR